MTMPPLFENETACAAFAEVLSTRALGKRLAHHLSTGSTNDLAAQAAREGAPHGFAVVAEAQTAGRGRRGRSWRTPPGQGLLLSVLIRTEGLPHERLGWLPLAAGLAGAETITDMAGVEATVKWPNDVVVMENAARPAALPPPRDGIPWRKLGGVLCESVLPTDGAGGYAVIGMGLNVLQEPDDFPEETKAPPTSLFLESGRRIDRALLLARLFETLETRLDALYADSAFDALGETLRVRLLESWGAYRLSLDAAGRTFEARVAGLDDFGRLQVDAPGEGRRALADAEILGAR